MSDSRDKGKDTVAVFVEFLYNHFDDPGVVHDNTRSDGSSSGLQIHGNLNLSQNHKRPFSWKYFATSHGKGVVDGIGGKSKAFVRAKIMTKWSFFSHQMIFQKQHSSY